MLFIRILCVFDGCFEQALKRRAKLYKQRIRVAVTGRLVDWHTNAILLELMVLLFIISFGREIEKYHDAFLSLLYTFVCL